jgi:transposase InsO family protein
MIKLSDVKVRPQYRTRVRYRLLVLEYASAHGPTAAGRHYGISARTIRRWRRRWRRDGPEGLVPAYPRHRPRHVTPAAIELIRQARQELGYGASRTRLWLQRAHGVRLAMGTIQRIFRDIGLPRLRRTRKRAPRQMHLFEKAEPGESIQVDVKFVKIAGRWAFQYTALDDCTRFRVLRLYRRLHHGSSLAFLAELQQAFPFPIKRLQCDHGQEFPFAFVLGVEAAGIRHRYIRPRRPQQNGKVERSHRIDQEEFWGRQRFPDFENAAAALRDWETRYNYERFSLALQGRTPAEKLAALRPPVQAA